MEMVLSSGMSDDGGGIKAALGFVLGICVSIWI